MSATSTVRKGPNPNLSQARYFRAMDKICEAPMTEYETQRLAELRTMARSSTGLGGPARSEYALLCCVEKRQREIAQGLG